MDGLLASRRAQRILGLLLQQDLPVRRGRLSLEPADPTPDTKSDLCLKASAPGTPGAPQGHAPGPLPPGSLAPT